MRTFTAEENVIYIDGKAMTISEWKKLKKKNEATKKKKARNISALRLLGERVAQINSSFKLAKNYKAYFRNGYRQWGVIARDIIHDEHIEPHFTSFIGAYNRAMDAAKKIEKLSKKSDKDIFGYIEKLAYAMDDMLTAINKIADGCVEAQIYVNPRFENEECVYGSNDGKRLGIKQLNARIGESLTTTTKSIKELLSMVNDGIDPMEYDADTKKTICFVTA